MVSINFHHFATAGLIGIRSTVFAIEVLCIFPQYTEPLRQEVEKQGVSPDGTPLLASFLKESARFTSINAGERFCLRKCRYPCLTFLK